MRIKVLLLIIGKSIPCIGGIDIPLSLSEWSFTIWLATYNRKQNVLSVSLIKIYTFLSYMSSTIYATVKFVQCMV